MIPTFADSVAGTIKLSSKPRCLLKQIVTGLGLMLGVACVASSHSPRVNVDWFNIKTFGMVLRSLRIPDRQEKALTPLRKVLWAEE